MLNFFSKKNVEERDEINSNSKLEDFLFEKDEEEKVIENTITKKEEKEPVLKIKTKEEINIDNITLQCIEMGMDIKKDVEKISRAFFNSNNSLKKESYLKFEAYISTLSNEKKRELQNMLFLDFKEKEEQITVVIKNGFAQFISKGSAGIDEESRKTLEIVFADIKKMPSKAHRYWYFKIYIWQKREVQKSN